MLHRSNRILVLPIEAKNVDENTNKNQLQHLATEYCHSSTIHGIKYIGTKQRNICEKIWWITAFLLSVYGCGSLIQNAYRKWQHSPVIVTFNEKSTPVWQIPFPAITICPETKVKAEFLDFTKFFTHYTTEDGTSKDARAYFHHMPAPIIKYPKNNASLNLENHNGTDHRRSPRSTDLDSKLLQKRFKAVAQVCNPSLFEGIDLNQPYDRGCVDLLRSSSVTREEMFMACRWRNSKIDCEDLFAETLTEEGPCFTFNSVAANDLLRQEELHKDYAYSGENRESPHWTLEKGYKDGVAVDTYPVRVLGAGPRAGLKIILILYDYDLNPICKGPVPGFKILFHTPSEYPQISKQYFLVPLDQEVLIMLKPQMITTSEGLRDYDPHRRLCYFNDERHLKYFKIYTQQNCELECTTNYTRIVCGCVRFSMPRDNGTKVCGASKIQCYNDAEDQLLTQAVEYTVNKTNDFLSKCDCLPACTSIQYDAEISQADHNAEVLSQAMQTSLEPGTRMAQLTIYFKDSQFVNSKRNEMYGVTDFLANCGGLLGLFMGFSLLSLVEIVYFCAIRPLSILCATVSNQASDNRVTATPPPPTASLAEAQWCYIPWK